MLENEESTNFDIHDSFMYRYPIFEIFTLDRPIPKPSMSACFRIPSEMETSSVAPCRVGHNSAYLRERIYAF